jgi:hypothetical protein
VAVQVLASPVVPHRGARVGVTGGDLDVAQVGASVKHGRDGVAQHVRVCPDDLDVGRLRKAVQAAGGRVPVRVPRLLIKTGPRVREPTARSIARPTAGGSGTRTILVPLPHTRSTRWPCSSPRSAISALVASKIRKPSRPSMATRAKSHGSCDWRAAVSSASNCR